MSRRSSGSEVSSVAVLAALSLPAALFLAARLRARARAAPEAEQKKIDWLLSEIGNPNADFIRNGTEYDAPKAASHLKTKLFFAGSRVQTVRQIIVERRLPLLGVRTARTNPSCRREAAAHDARLAHGEARRHTKKAPAAVDDESPRLRTPTVAPPRAAERAGGGSAPGIAYDISAATGAVSTAALPCSVPSRALRTRRSRRTRRRSREASRPGRRGLPRRARSRRPSPRPPSSSSRPRSGRRRASGRGPRGWSRLRRTSQ